MYGDTAVIRRLATKMDERATDLRATADKPGRLRGHRALVVGQRRADARPGARAGHPPARDRRGLRGRRRQSLRAHADKVDEIKALIDRIERMVGNLVEGALDRLKEAGHAIVEGVKDGVRAVGNLVGLGGGGDEPDPRDVRLAQYKSPPPGDKAWLDAPDHLGIEV
ncbi:hypothetical protein G5V59_06105 [Nocardioides sp. W3-2-3]|uniref:hypothetical protein n=1 Tax=Nocardioides convexus TaxID=2712224 RepID=UPI002418B757|nr:hypothetical protein [Nocardioides convexus]NGZ99955.1 hypothetical protein [Nocardioides convexus]